MQRATALHNMEAGMPAMRYRPVVRTSYVAAAIASRVIAAMRNALRKT
jgi:hypothetical protein